MNDEWEIREGPLAGQRCRCVAVEGDRAEVEIAGKTCVLPADWIFGDGGGNGSGNGELVRPPTGGNGSPQPKPRNGKILVERDRDPLFEERDRLLEVIREEIREELGEEYSSQFSIRLGGGFFRKWEVWWGYERFTFPVGGSEKAFRRKLRMFVLKRTRKSP
jgi:hypothetical protein